jgi:hypothetical protein
MEIRGIMREMERYEECREREREKDKQIEKQRAK